MIFVLLLALTTPIEIAPDASSARAVLALFDKGSATDEELAAAAKLFGNQQLIAKARGYDPSATEEAFIATLRTAIEGKPLAKDPFRWTRVRERLPKTRALLARFDKDPAAFLADVRARMARYTPPDLAMRVNVHFLLGGTSDGFTRDAQNFYVALDYLEDDVEGLKLLMAHELFHLAQAKMEPKTPSDLPDNAKRAMTLLRGTMREGTASALADPTAVANPGSYNRWFADKYRRNLDRLPMLFALFDTLLFRLYHDPSADTGLLGNIAFSGTFDSAMYFVGYRMARVIEKHRGREAVVKALQSDPVEFFTTYAAIDDPEAIKLSAGTMEILKKLAR